MSLKAAETRAQLGETGPRGWDQRQCSTASYLITSDLPLGGQCLHAGTASPTLMAGQMQIDLRSDGSVFDLDIYLVSFVRFSV